MYRNSRCQKFGATRWGYLTPYILWQISKQEKGQVYLDGIPNSAVHRLGGFMVVCNGNAVAQRPLLALPRASSTRKHDI